MDIVCSIKWLRIMRTGDSFGDAGRRFTLPMVCHYGPATVKDRDIDLVLDTKETCELATALIGAIPMGYFDSKSPEVEKLIKLLQFINRTITE